jgi:hypothetical protein
MSRPYAPEEVRDQILIRLHDYVNYWTTVELKGSDYDLKSLQDEIKYRIDGAIFSSLAMLDGSTDLPAFDLVPSPHPDDRDYHIQNGDNYYDGTPISFALHEYWHRGAGSEGS